MVVVCEFQSGGRMCTYAGLPSRAAMGSAPETEQEETMGITPKSPHASFSLQVASPNLITSLCLTGLLLVHHATSNMDALMHVFTNLLGDKKLRRKRPDFLK